MSITDADKVPILTVGYGSRTLAELIAVLKQHHVAFVVDVRTQPYSRFKPEFSQGNLENELKEHGLMYLFLGDKLGGRPEDDDCYTQGKVDYDKCRASPRFLEGIARLRTAWDKRLRVALLCSEGKPDQCHRSKLIGQTLVDNQIGVMHIDVDGSLLTQEEVTLRVTGGQLDLFGAPQAMLVSRKKYAPAEKER